MAETLITAIGVKDSRVLKMIFAVSGIMTTLVIYGILQACRFIVAHFSDCNFLFLLFI